MKELCDGLNELDRDCPSAHHRQLLLADTCIDDDTNEEDSDKF